MATCQRSTNAVMIASPLQFALVYRKRIEQSRSKESSMLNVSYMQNTGDAAFANDFGS